MSEIRTARFAAPDEARERYDAIIPAYQAAFAAEPWYEVSKCSGCSSGYSRQNPGDICQACGSTTGDEAYTEQELTEKFDAIGETRPTCWYIEETPAGLILAAVAWTADLVQIAPAMTRAAMRDFGDDATIDKAKSDVPDWRNFVSIDLSR